MTNQRLVFAAQLYPTVSALLPLQHQRAPSKSKVRQTLEADFFSHLDVVMCSVFPCSPSPRPDLVMAVAAAQGYQMK